MIVDILATIQEAYEEGVADMRMAAMDYHSEGKAREARIIKQARATMQLGTATSAHQRMQGHEEALQHMQNVDLPRKDTRTCVASSSQR